MCTFRKFQWKRTTLHHSSYGRSIWRKFILGGDILWCNIWSWHNNPPSMVTITLNFWVGKMGPSSISFWRSFKVLYLKCLVKNKNNGCARTAACSQENCEYILELTQNLGRLNRFKIGNVNSLMMKLPVLLFWVMLLLSKICNVFERYCKFLKSTCHQSLGFSPQTCIFSKFT